MKHSRIVEVVVCKTSPDISEADMLAVAHQLQARVQQFPGYIDRQLLKGADGQWVDIVWWQSLEEAQAANDALMQDADLAPYMVVFEKAEMTMFHLEPVALTRA